jgi:hypothetical protein
VFVHGVFVRANGRGVTRGWAFGFWS